MPTLKHLKSIDRIDIAEDLKLCSVAGLVWCWSFLYNHSGEERKQIIIKFKMYYLDSKDHLGLMVTEELASKCRLWFVQLGNKDAGKPEPVLFQILPFPF